NRISRHDVRQRASAHGRTELFDQLLQFILVCTTGGRDGVGMEEAVAEVDWKVEHRFQDLRFLASRVENCHPPPATGQRSGKAACHQERGGGELAEQDSGYAGAVRFGPLAAEVPQMGRGDLACLWPEDLDDGMENVGFRRIVRLQGREKPGVTNGAGDVEACLPLSRVIGPGGVVSGKLLDEEAVAFSRKTLDLPPQRRAVRGRFGNPAASKIQFELLPHPLPLARMRSAREMMASLLASVERPRS